MELCLSTGSLFKLTLPEIFEIAREAGFEGIELLICRRVSRPYDLETAMELSERVLPVKAVHSPFFRFKNWQGKISSLKRAVTWARLLGAKVVTFHPPSWLNLEFFFWLWLRGVKDFEEETGRAVALSMEIMPVVGKKGRVSGYFWNNPHSLVKFAKRRNLCVTLDITHMATRDQDIIPLFLSLYEPELVRNIHFSDFGQGQQHRFPGRGNLPITRFLNLLRHLAYRGLLTVELTPRELPDSRAELVEELKALVDYVKEVVR